MASCLVAEADDALIRQGHSEFWPGAIYEQVFDLQDKVSPA